MSEADYTTAQRYVIRELNRVIGSGSFRTGVLLLSYPSEVPGDDCRFVHAVAMRQLTAESALDLVMLIRRLRVLADEVQATVDGISKSGGVDGSRGEG